VHVNAPRHCLTEPRKHRNVTAVAEHRTHPPWPEHSHGEAALSSLGQ
jgi:hypothetical protein